MKKAITHKAKQEKEKEEKKKESLLHTIPNLNYEIEQLRQELALKDDELQRAEADKAILRELYDQGVINAEGDIIK